MMKAAGGSAALDTPKTPQPEGQAYKKGDIVSVLYRGGKYWPAKVTAFYPKEQKISHIWFPINRKSIKSIFKAPLSKVQEFNPDTLPANATDDLVFSYEQAARLLQGVTEEQLLEEIDQEEAEYAAMATPKSAGKKKTTAELLKKTPKSTPKVTKQRAAPKYHQQQQQVASSEEEQLPALLPPQPLVPKPGDAVIVDTQVGMWPGIFQSVVEGDPSKVNYVLFPRKQPAETHEGLVQSIMPFPQEQIEQSINDGVGSDQLLEALRDALRYVLERNAQNVQPPIGGSQSPPQPPMAAGAGSPRKSPVKSAEIVVGSSAGGKVKAQALKTAPTEAQRHMKMKAAQRNTLDGFETPKETIHKTASSSAENKPNQHHSSPPKMAMVSTEEKQHEEHEHQQVPTKTKATGQARLSEKRGAHHQLGADTGGKQPMLLQGSVSPAQPVPKKRKLNSTEMEDGEEAEEGGDSPLGLFSPARREKASRLGGSTSSAPNASPKQLISRGEGVNVMGASAERADEDMSKAEEKHEEEDDEVVAESPAEEQPKLQKQPQKSPMPVAPANEKRPPSKSLFELAKSNEAHQYVSEIWADTEQQWFKKMGVESSDIDFKRGDLLTLNETEKLFSEVQKWIKNSRAVPPMSTFREAYFILNWVLPGLCVFALSKAEGISLEKAEKVYEERCSKKPKNSLNTLAMAANMMEEGQNGNGGTASGAM